MVNGWQFVIKNHCRMSNFVLYIISGFSTKKSKLYKSKFLLRINILRDRLR